MPSKIVVARSLILLLVPLLTSAAFLGGPPTPYPTGSYDAASARGYFLRRPLRLASRAVEIGFKSASFAGALLSDALSGEELDGPRADERGEALTDLLVELGPAFIKIGQVGLTLTLTLTLTLALALALTLAVALTLTLTLTLTRCCAARRCSSG